MTPRAADLCRLLGIRFPIIQSGMSRVAGAPVGQRQAEGGEEKAGAGGRTPIASHAGRGQRPSAMGGVRVMIVR